MSWSLAVFQPDLSCRLLHLSTRAKDNRNLPFCLGPVPKAKNWLVGPDYGKKPEASCPQE